VITATVKGRTFHRYTSKSGLTTVIGIHAFARYRLRVRFFPTVDLVNLLEAERVLSMSGHLARDVANTDMVIPDELGYLPFSKRAAVPTAQQALRAH
jgi:DNA replication protein DnaC